MEKFNKLKDTVVMRKIMWFFESKWFVLAFVALVYLSSVFGLEMLCFYTTAIVFVFISIFCEDTKPVIVMVLTTAFAPSVQNFTINGSTASNDNFLISQPEVIVQLSILIGLLLASMIAHIFIYKKAKAMVTTRTQLFAGILFMCIALLLSGADVYSGFSNFEAVGISIEYNILNLVFALIEIFALFLFYYYFYFTATWDKDSLRFLSFVVTVAGLLVATQLFTRAIIQAVNGNLFIKGTNYSINRGALSLGWGIANNIGGLIVITIPSAMYLATTEKSKSWLYYIFACIIMLANALTMCRTSLVVSLLIFPTCVIIACIKGANRKANLITTGAVFGVILLGVLCFMPQIKELFGRIVNDGLIVGEDGALADSGRIKIWTTALDNLRRAPFFGAGFFTDVYGSLEAGGVFNNMYHNVVMQMIGSCGIVGLLAYFTHCVQIFKVAFKKINLNRLFVLLGIISVIGVSLADNNIFYLSVGLYYSVFLMALEKDSDLTLKLSKINI